MTPERWQRIKELFDAALEREGEARARFLSQATQDDPSLASEVLGLLASDQEAGAFLSAPPLSPSLGESLGEPVPNLLGRHIGPYRVLGEIGHGGMGTVYRAVRDDDQYQKQVAIKLVRGGMDAEFVLQRFKAERQILANLEHPNIARLIDGGTTEEGWPYFSMEYVEGQPIDRYCAGLGVRERLDLFRIVCAAVQYAHQRLVIHRDLKPGNIFVSADGVPKLLDFGIAKLLGADPPGPGEATLTVWPLMTPEYASPEQVKGEAATTASDVYSLGMLLYELLARKRPYEIKTRAPEEVARVVCQQQPEKPSVRADRPLSRQLKGDLDTIVLKAIRKEPARRYQTVGELSEDLHRYLAGLPVLARGDTVGYRAGKFVRRHKAAVVVAGLLVASLLGGILATVRQARIAEANRARAERRFGDVRKLANSFLFEFHDAIATLPGSTPARELVVRKALEYLDSLAAEAQGSPSLQLELASAYEKVGDVQGALGAASLGQTPAAHRSYARAVELREAVAAAGPLSVEAQRDLAMARKRLATMRLAEGDWTGATRLFERARDVYVSLAAERPDDFAAQVDAAGSRVNVGIAWGMSGRRHEGLRACEEGLAAARKLAASAPADTRLKNLMGIGLIWVGNIATAIPERRERALEAIREATALYEALAAAEPDNAFWRLKIGDTHVGASFVLTELARWDEAVVPAQQAEAIYSSLESADPKSGFYREERVAAQGLRARALLGRGDLGSAEPLLLEAERAMLEQYASQPENVLLRERLAGVQGDRGRYHQLRASRSGGAARIRHLQMAIEWMRKAEGHLDELHAQHRVPLGTTEELERLRRRRAECETALGTHAGPRPSPYDSNAR
ncbi:MAG TPA: serine/threonine-protein kinase [Vicinamibacteria bacterium]|nr:serine/threonine-protein kinase [Vicinamibacteria bacterium]